MELEESVLLPPQIRTNAPDFTSSFEPLLLHVSVGVGPVATNQQSIKVSMKERERGREEVSMVTAVIFSAVTFYGAQINKRAAAVSQVNTGDGSWLTGVIAPISQADFRPSARSSLVRGARFLPVCSENQPTNGRAAGVQRGDQKCV